MATKKEMIEEILSISTEIHFKYGEQILEEADWTALRTLVRQMRRELKNCERHYE